MTHTPLRYSRNRPTDENQMRSTLPTLHSPISQPKLISSFRRHFKIPIISANTIVRLATLKVKYRMGFSGSPYREDGREKLHYSLNRLSNWHELEELIRLQIMQEPTFRVYILSDNREKMRKLGELLQIPSKH